MLKSYKPSFSSALYTSALMDDTYIELCAMHNEKLSVSLEMPSSGFRLPPSSDVLI